jgi:hypothetical protein
MQMPNTHVQHPVIPETLAGKLNGRMLRNFGSGAILTSAGVLCVVLSISAVVSGIGARKNHQRNVSCCPDLVVSHSMTS